MVSKAVVGGSEFGGGAAEKTGEEGGAGASGGSKKQIGGQRRKASNTGHFTSVRIKALNTSIGRKGKGRQLFCTYLLERPKFAWNRAQSTGNRRCLPLTLSRARARARLQLRTKSGARKPGGPPTAVVSGTR